MMDNKVYKFDNEGTECFGTIVTLENTNTSGLTQKEVYDLLVANEVVGKPGELGTKDTTNYIDYVTFDFMNCVIGIKGITYANGLVHVNVSGQEDMINDLATGARRLKIRALSSDEDGKPDEIITLDVTLK